MSVPGGSPANVGRELGGDLQFEPDGLLSTLFDETAEPRTSVEPASPSDDAQLIEEEAPDELSAEEFEELPVASETPPRAGPSTSPPTSAEDDDIDALLEHTAPDSEPLHGDWEPPTAPQLAPLPARESFPTPPVSARAPSIKRTVPFTTRLDHSSPISVPDADFTSVPDSEDEQPTGAFVPRSFTPSALADEELSRQVTLPDADRDAPTRIERRLHVAAAGAHSDSVVDLRTESFASIHDYERQSSFASIQDDELEEDEPLERPSFSTRVEGSAASALSDERSAAAHLAEQNAQALWLERAERLEIEARAKADPQAKARGLLVASELWAMAGNVPRAREAAGAAAALARSNPIATRQNRWLAAASGDWKSVAQTLDAEAKGSAAPEARAHAAYLAAEVQRLALQDEAGAKRLLDLALRADPSDPRPHVSKLASQLAKTPAPPRSRLPEGPGFASLNAAVDEIARLRGAPSAAELSDNPKVAFQAARRALALGDRAAAGTAVLALSQIGGLERPALWLAAALFAPIPELRPRAIELLTRLLDGPDAQSARRALAARGLEQEDRKAIETALAPRGGDADQEAFSPGDCVALVSLMPNPEHAVSRRIALEPWLHELSLDETLRPMATAALSAASEPSAPLDVLSGNERSRSEVALGRALVSARTHGGDRARLDAAFEAFTTTHRDSALGKLLELELSLGQRRADRVAALLAAWPREGSEERDADRDRHLASALIHEFGANADDAVREYTQALAADPGSEASVRALLTRAAPDRAVPLLRNLAGVCVDNAQASLLFIEAALRVGLGGDGFGDLLERAVDAQPSLPFAQRLGEQLARSQGDVDGLLKWLRLRRDYATDPIERALDLVREALLVADDDMPRAAKLLEEALKARPSDVALHELHERLTSGVSVERGRWRERLAEQTEGPLKLRLLLEAALEYERAGDSENAGRAALLAAEAKDSEFARVIADRAASSGASASLLSERLFSEARAEQDPRAQRELYERLSALDRVRGDNSSALLWHSAILERTPDHLPALRRLEHAYIGAGRDEDLEPIAAALAPLLDASEANAHACLAARLYARTGTWSNARAMAEIAARVDPAPLWALRALSAHARAADDDATLLDINRKLGARTTHATDAATLSLRAAEAAARLGKLAEADKLLAHSIELVPQHLVALAAHAEVLQAAGDFAGAAQAFEGLASTSNVPRERLTALHSAAVLWQDKLLDLDRAQTALEKASELEGAPEDVFTRLQAVYVSRNDRARLATLLERRLEKTTDPEQRIVLEVTRGRALADIGDRDSARRALTAALDANPDHVGALSAFADLCMKEGDFQSAEQALIRLGRLVGSSEEQAAIYSRLGELYDRELANPERAELAYKEVLKRNPNDVGAAQRLVQVYGKLGDPARAVELQNELVQRAETPQQKRDATLGLALVYEQIVGDRRKAEATLDKARKTWNQDAVVLRALAELHRRAGEHAALGVLLDRSAADARRALQTGRFDPAFFEMLAEVAELRGQTDAALVARATLASLGGEAIAVNGAGASAADPNLDDLLAPELLSSALRALLRKCGDAFDVAYPLDLRTLRATPLEHESAALFNSIQRLAGAFGLQNCEVLVSPVIGRVCLPASSAPARLVIGNTLLEASDDAARYFLVIRALKILQGHAGALSRTAPIELWPVLAGFLSLFAQNWQPQGIDARRLADAQQRLQSALSRRVDDDVPTLALEVIGSIGNRASQLATAVNQWGNRAGLLALGDPAAATRGIACITGQSGTLPSESAERVKWIVRNPEARDIAVFSVSEQYAEARRRLGLAR